MTATGSAHLDEAVIAPGSVVVVRDEEWLVTNVEPAPDGRFVHVLGLSELVRDTEAVFSTALDRVEPLDPAAATVVADGSPGFRRAKLWVEAMLRKSAAPVADPAIPVATGALADALEYQQAAVRKALDPENLRPRILLDAHQRIFGQRVVLGRLGIAVVGRSRSLTLNYRTTAENLSYALGALTGETFLDGEGAEDSTAHYRSARSGPKPHVIGAASTGEELESSADVVHSWIESGHAPESIGVLVRTKHDMQRLAAALEERGIPARQVDTGTRGATKGQVQVMTMYRAKGMEFECVLITGVGADDLPARWGLKDLDEADRADFLQRERSLIYVSATRARDELAVVWSGEPSELLPSV